MTDPDAKPAATPGEAALMRAVVLRLSAQHLSIPDIATAVRRDPATVKRILSEALREVAACSIDDAQLVLVQARANFLRQLERLEARMVDRPGHGYEAYDAYGKTYARYLALHGIRIDSANQVTQINIASPGAALEMRDAASPELQRLMDDAMEEGLGRLLRARELPEGEPGADPEVGAG